MNLRYKLITAGTALLFLSPVFLPAVLAPAQSKPLPPVDDSSMPGPHGQHVPVVTEPTPTEQERHAKLEANKQRQQEIRRDADRLLQLATDLKLAVDKSNENVLSLDVVKKATDIEKLAKTVREKMKAER